MGEPKIIHTKSFPGKYQYPRRIEKESNNVEIINIESKNTIINFLLALERTDI